MDQYVEWMRLTNHGKKLVAPEELEKIGVRRVQDTWWRMSPEEQDEAKRAYEAVVEGK